MPRYTFGGQIQQLVVAADASLGGALKAAPGVVLPAFYNKPASDATRVVVTDFLVDSNGDGTFDQATGQIVTDATGYPPYFQGPDGVVALYDQAGRRLDPHDRTGEGGSSGPASTTVAGVAELATTDEALAGTDVVRIVTPAGVAAVMGEHQADANAHPALSEAVAGVQAALPAKADLSGGLVVLDQIPKTQSATPNALLQLGPTGAAVVAPGAADNEAATILQVNSKVAAGAGGADVRHRASTVTTPGSTSPSAFTTIPSVAVTDAKSGQVWRCDYALDYRATAVNGFQVRFKGNAVAVTNKLANPSFEVDTTNWVAGNGNTALGRGTAGGGFDGAAYLTLTAINPATLLAYSEWVPTVPGDSWSTAAYARLGTGTSHPFRSDLQFADAAGTVLGTNVDESPPSSTATFQRTENTLAVTPTGATQVRVRLAYPSALAGEVVHFDAVQLEPTAQVPPYGSTGGSGSLSLEVVGGWLGYTTAAPTADDFRRRGEIRYPAVANLTTDHGGRGATTDASLIGSFLVTVGGTGLTGQRIELEFAPRAADGANAPALVYADATFARIA